MAASPCKAMDTIQEAFTARYGDLIGDKDCVQWDRSEDAARQLIFWGLFFKGGDDLMPLIDKQDARDLEILCSNAVGLLKRDSGQEKEADKK